MTTDTPTRWRSGLPVTPCGMGSILKETVVIRSFLASVVGILDIHTIADVGCGDQNWIHKTNWPHPVRTVGYDVDPIDPETVIKFNCITEVLPRSFDLVLCIYVMNHMRKQVYKSATIKNFAKSGSKFLLCNYLKGFEPFREPPLDSVHHNFKADGHEWRYGLWLLN